MTFRLTVQGSPNLQLRFKNADGWVGNPLAITYNTAGNTINASQLPAPGTYQIYLKGANSLQRRFDNITLAANQANSFDWSATPLLAGDIDSNNAIDTNDLTAFLGAWFQYRTPVTATNINFDLTNDGFLDIQDLSLIITNWIVSPITYGQN
jgi:hypothetical protein